MTRREDLVFEVLNRHAERVDWGDVKCKCGWCSTINPRLTAAEQARAMRAQHRAHVAAVIDWTLGPPTTRKARRSPPRPPAGLNADCVRGYHGCLDEDGCQFATTSGDL